MDFDAAKAAFFVPRPDDAPAPSTDARGGPARVLRDALEPIAMIDLWTPLGYAEIEALGLDFLSGYVWGRASALGDPSPGAVVAAFGVFEPGLVTASYEAGRAACSAAAVRTARATGAERALREVLGDPEEVGIVTEALRMGLKVCSPAGRSLYAGLASLTWPEAPLAGMWHAASLLREYRGDTHLAACVASGLDAVEMNLLTELWVGWEAKTYSATRGWSDKQLFAGLARLARRGLIDGLELNQAGRETRDGIEDLTDALMSPVLAAIGADLDGLTDQVTVWSDAIVAHGSFPPDRYKQVSG